MAGDIIRLEPRPGGLRIASQPGGMPAESVLEQFAPLPLQALQVVRAFDPDTEMTAVGFEDGQP